MKLHNSISVTYETQILENGRVVKRNAPKRNLLLDSGLDGIAVRSFWDSFAYCVLGDGTTPTKRDSGAITVTIASEVATASAGYFEAGDVGRLLKLDSGQEVYIDGFTSATEVSVSGASDDSASEATIWYVDETGHANELVRTNTLGGDSGDVTSTWDGSKIEHKRTFIFPTEGSSRTYREIGWSHTASAGGNLLGRDLIPGGGDAIAEGQQYKVVVKLNVSLSPLNQTATPDVGTGGIDLSGTAILFNLVGAFKGATTSGVFRTSDGIFEPHSSKYVYVFAADFSLPASPETSTGETITNNKVALAKDAYVAGNHWVAWRTTFDVNGFNNIFYGVALCGVTSGTDVRRVWAMKLDSTFTKDSDHTLELAFKISWGRTLTN